MKRSLPTLLVTALVLFLGAWASAADAAPAPNAALVYWRAFSVIPELTRDEETLMTTLSAPLGKDTAIISIKWEPALQLMYEASAIPECYWGIDYDKEGTSAVLSHLANARKLARGACFHARYIASAGDLAGAAKDIESTVILARQVGSENLISTLVELAIEKIATDAAARCMVNTEAAGALSGMIDRCLQGVPQHLARATLLGEVITFQSAFGAEVERRASGETLPALLGEAGLPAATDAKTLLSCVADSKKRYLEAAEIVDLPGPEFQKRFGALKSEVAAGGNLLLKGDQSSFLTVIPKIRGYEMELKARWTMMEAGAAYLTGGKAAFAPIRDPYGDGPFALTVSDGGFTLESKLPSTGTEEPLMLKFGAVN